MNDELNPPASPCYAPPPWNYTGARMLNVVCRAEHADAVYRWVPMPLKPSRDDGMFVIFFMKVPSIPELGEHYHSTECGILIPAMTADGQVRGATFAIMYLDNDVALAGGREIWGYPKKLGSLTFDEHGNDLTVVARHLDYRDKDEGVIFTAQAKFDGSNEQIWDVVAGLEPRLLHRVIPDPYGPVAQSSEVLKVVHTHGRVYEKKTGSATVEFGVSEERFNEWGAVEVLGATFRVCDFVLPYAHRI